MTKNAELILNIINNSMCHPTAEEIFFEAKKVSPKIVMATVYNNLATLTSEGLIRKIKAVGAADRYDSTMHGHDHLVCDRCGALADITVEELPQILKSVTKGRMTSYNLTVGYICDDCLNKSRQ